MPAPHNKQALNQLSPHYSVSLFQAGAQKSWSAAPPPSCSAEGIRSSLTSPYNRTRWVLFSPSPFRSSRTGGTERLRHLPHLAQVTSDGGTIGSHSVRVGAPARLREPPTPIAWRGWVASLPAGRGAGVAGQRSRQGRGGARRVRSPQSGNNGAFPTPAPRPQTRRPPPPAPRRWRAAKR